MKSFLFRLKFHWSLFLRVQLAITQHCFRYWLCTVYATSHYLNQCWPKLLTHICGTSGRWVKTTGSCRIESSCSCRWGGYGICSFVWKAILDAFPIPVLKYSPAPRAADSAVYTDLVPIHCGLKALHQPAPWSSTLDDYKYTSGLLVHLGDMFQLQTSHTTVLMFAGPDLDGAVR